MVALKEMTVEGFLDTLASDAPAPGGGSAAALSGALGAALVSMVCELTRGKEKYAQHEALATETGCKAKTLMSSLMECVQKDTSAFDGVIAALKMPKGTDGEKAARSDAIQAAYKVAIASPEEIAEQCLEVMRLAKGMLHKCNANAASDLSVAALSAQAGLLGALENVAINLPSIKDAVYVGERRGWIVEAEREGVSLLSDVRSGVAEMIGQA